MPSAHPHSGITHGIMVFGRVGDKIAERFGGCSAYGPVLQGLVKPGNDLSRGCTAEEVVNTVILTILQTAL